MTAVAAGLSLVPLSVALFGFARAAPRLGAAVGVRTMMVGGSLLLALGCAIAWMSQAGAGFAILMLGLFAAGAGIALPYASAPRIAPRNAAADADRQRAPACSTRAAFSAEPSGVTCGGIVFGHAGFAGVLALVGLSALAGGRCRCGCE